MKYAGVVVLYNPDKKVLDNIKTYSDDLERIYLIDNSSVDNSKLFVNFSNIEYLANFENLGIAKALNIGANKAISDKIDFLLTMDQDSSFEKKGINDMKNFIEKRDDLNEIAIISPFHKTILTPNVPEIEISDPLIVMTSGNLINLKAYQAVGGFKEWLFIDCVDFAYCLDLRRLGYKIIQYNKVVLNHALGAFEKKKFLGKTYLCDNHNAIRRYYIVRNSHYIYDEYYSDYPQYCNAVLGDVRHGYFIVTFLEKNKIKKLWFMLKGYLHYKRGVKGRLGG